VKASGYPMQDGGAAADVTFADASATERDPGSSAHSELERAIDIGIRRALRRGRGRNGQARRGHDRVHEHSQISRVS
jgi:hypothetical protein